jgi:hypothetical protein
MGRAVGAYLGLLLPASDSSFSYSILLEDRRAPEAQAECKRRVLCPGRSRAFPSTPEKVLRTWAREWFMDGRKMDLEKLPERPAFENLLRRRVAERTFARISHNRRMSEVHERLCSTGEAFVHAAMARLMVGRLARA